MCEIEVGKWYKHRGSFDFIYIIKKEDVYDYSGYIVWYLWIGELEKNNRKSMFAERSEFTTGSEFHSSLYLITIHDLIPPADVMAKCKLLMIGEEEYVDLYPGQRKPDQIHPWRTWKE